MFALQGNEQVLVIRLGAMGDVLHALPAVEALRRSFPFLRIDWLVKPHWMPLLHENPHLRRLIPYRRDSFQSLRDLAADLRVQRYEVAIDLQGLLQSALLGLLSGARQRAGYARVAAREKLAALFYNLPVTPQADHIVHKHLEVVKALGATRAAEPCWLPLGQPDGDLPDEPFVLAAPFAGWASKQWPLDYYAQLGQMLHSHNLRLVLNVAAQDRARVASLPNVAVHCSSIEGLIDATRRARAVVGVDSGPLHLALALGKPGVAIFGPTDPARNGPWPLAGGPMMLLRAQHATTSYKREKEIAPSMREVSPVLVRDALLAALEAESLLPAPHRGKC